MSITYFPSILRAMKEQELDTPSIEKRFAYTFLQQLITYVDEAHEHMLEFGKYFSTYANFLSGKIRTTVEHVQCLCFLLQISDSIIFSVDLFLHMHQFTQSFAYDNSSTERVFFYIY